MRQLLRSVVLSIVLACAGSSLVTAAQNSAAMQALVRDPEVAARKLYDAWQAKNRAAARAIASDAALTKIFAVAAQSMTLHACQRTDVGEFQCVYRNAKDDFEVWFKVIGGASAGYHVEAVSLSTD